MIVAAPLVGAQSTPSDRSPHLLLVPDTAKATAALEKTNARTLARYEAFTLVEARGEDEADLRSAGADRRDDMREVSLPGGEFDPSRSRSSLAAKGAADPDETLALVQFAGPVKDAWLDRLRDSGARIVQYVPQNAYVVHASGNEVERLAGLVGTVPAVRAVTRMTGADKLGEGVPASGDSRLVAIQTLAGADGADARRAVTAAGVRARADSNVGGLTTQFVELTGAEVDALAADPAVVAVMPYSMPRLLDERSAQIVAGNLTAGGQPTGPGYLSWLGMQGLAAPLDFAIDVADTGLDDGSTTPGHADFYTDGVMPGTSRVAYVQNGTDDATAGDCSGHGTNVASVAAGFGAGAGSQHGDALGFKYGMGAAPRAELGVTKIFNCANTLDLPAGGFTALAAQAYAGGARVSNQSWGNQDLGRYSPDSREFDFLVRDAQPATGLNEEMVEVFAAGNQGDDRPGAANEGWASIASPGTAKNVITVGASEGVRPLGQLTCGIGDSAADQARDIIDFSSRGPTNDGRMKPDVVAPGTRIVGAAPQTGVDYQGTGVCTKFFEGPFYSLESGTSQAAPAVSGAAALIRQWFDDEQGAPPSPAMTKAILVGSATDLAGGDNGKGDVIAAAPNADQGWGRAHLGGAFDVTERDYFDQDFVLGASGERFARAYDVQDTSKPLKVTLAWTDAPGAVDANPALVNDLDLVVRQGGRTYKGNVFAGGRSITGGDADRRNNLESVTLPQATGRFSVEVLGTNIAGNGVPGVGDGLDQDFALVVSNAQAQPSPVLAPEAVVLVRLSGARGDDDGSLERDEQFDLTVGLRNGGDQNATGLSGSTLRVRPVIHSGQRHLGEHRAGAAATNPAPFVGTLASGATCGADVTATLALTTDQGPSSLPVTIPTGEPGIPLTSIRSHAPPLPIPDESSAGVTSTISVASPGPVRDVNVDSRRPHAHLGGRPRDRADLAAGHDRQARPASGRPRQRRERLRQHDLRRRGADERVDRKRALHRQLQAPERPALALRRRAAPGNLDAARARSLRGRRRHLDELADDDAPRHLQLRGSSAARYRDNGGTVGARRLAQRVVQLRRKRRRCQLRVQPGRRAADGVRHAAWRGRPRRRHAHPARPGPRRRGQPRPESSRAKLDRRHDRAPGFALDASSGRVTAGRSAATRGLRRNGDRRLRERHRQALARHLGGRAAGADAHRAARRRRCVVDRPGDAGRRYLDRPSGTGRHGRQHRRLAERDLHGRVAVRRANGA